MRNDFRTLSTAVVLVASLNAQAGVDYTREVRPILSQHCFKCHGPDDNARKAGLRLDLKETATVKLPSDDFAIVPRAPDKSELVRRINADDAGEVMPPPSTKNPLTAKEKETLRRWIAEGAEYQLHWSFVPPKSVPPPKVKHTEWLRTPIDAFVLAKLEAAGLSPSPEADRYTLARRVSLDLIGLPPTPAELEAFVNDPTPDAYERYVDRLLASPRYGERWARRWLDLARYADTNGYEKDRTRSIWPYRDWVVNALNADKPYDQFSIEQLAGDMLPNAGLSERVATGFHRNTMLNEEGGIDPLEFRFHAMTDRVAVSANTWLGLTFQCAQCHTHKFDPIPHRDYYALMAFMDNTEEPLMDVPTPEQERKRKEIEKEIERRYSDEEMIEAYTIDKGIEWRAATINSFRSTSGVGLELNSDKSVRLIPATKRPERDDYIFSVQTDGPVDSIRLEALSDPQLPSRGPGLTPHGNFVLTEFSAFAAGKPIALTALGADVTQHEFSAAATLDKNPRTGWAVDVGERRNADHYIDYALSTPISSPTPLTVRLEQRYGGGHTIGKFRVLLGKRRNTAPLTFEQRKKIVSDRFETWLKDQRKKAVRWWGPRLVKEDATTATLLTIPSAPPFSPRIQSVGDVSKSDTYTLQFESPNDRPITALRLDAFTDDRLPGHGPGRVYYEGTPGDFFLSEFTVFADGKPIKIKSARSDYSSGNDTPMAALDGDPQTGWSVAGATGKCHWAVFTFEKPLVASKLEVKMLFERYYAAPLGDFRILATSNPNPTASDLDPDIGLMLSAAEPPQGRILEVLFACYLSEAPELAAFRAQIEQMRSRIPAPATTLVMQERKLAPPRVTHRRHRGEYLQSKEPVAAATPSALPKPHEAPKDRLSFARWLVSAENPLCDRVAVNRQWAAFFGRGLVRTQEDFGSQGEAPTHPALLDWLAVEFRHSGLSMKHLHRLIVTSAVYRQSTRVSPELLARDSDNALLERFPSVRLEGELVRDSVLAAAGLLSQKMLGPPVFPPQPPGVTTEGAYRPLDWRESQGEDRYRRGLYTFARRTTPYAFFATFDAPSGEACVVRREASNTPLQALSTLNDRTIVEASQALGRWAARQPYPPATILNLIVLRCLGRPATSDETDRLQAFFEKQKRRLTSGALDPKRLAGANGDATAAAWTAVVRTVFNLHEAVVKP